MRSIGRQSMFLMRKVTAHQARIKYSVLNLVMLNSTDAQCRRCLDHEEKDTLS